MREDERLEVILKRLDAEAAMKNLREYEKSGVAVPIVLDSYPQIYAAEGTEDIVGFSAVFCKGGDVGFYVDDGERRISSQHGDLRLLYIPKAEGHELYVFEAQCLLFFPEEALSPANAYDFLTVCLRMPTYRILIHLSYLIPGMKPMVSRIITDETDGIFYDLLVDGMAKLAMIPNSNKKFEAMRALSNNIMN